MSKELALDDKQGVKRPKPEEAAPAAEQDQRPDVARVLSLQQKVGNQAVQRLLAQRSGEAPFELDETTASRINQARGGGQALDGAVQKQMSGAMGYDFSDVQVHTSPEADDLNHQLSARAFTTGQDIFFKEGEYQPDSGSGQELIAHELTHVVQQSSGQVGGSGSSMTVNPPGDVYEQEADAVAQQALRAGPADNVQAAGNEVAQRQETPEEEELQMKALQRQETPEEEELQMKAVQRQEIPEEEELQM